MGHWKQVQQNDWVKNLKAGDKVLIQKNYEPYQIEIITEVNDSGIVKVGYDPITEKPLCTFNIHGYNPAIGSLIYHTKTDIWFMRLPRRKAIEEIRTRAIIKELQERLSIILNSDFRKYFILEELEEIFEKLDELYRKVKH